MLSRQYRFERKYYLNSFAADILRQKIVGVLQRDKHSQNQETGYHISSLYFDDFYNTALHQKQSGVLLRNKLRIRYYNNDYTLIRLENKHKYGEMVCKESVPVTKTEYTAIQHKNFSSIQSKPEQLWQMFNTRRVTMGLHPVVLVQYQREAFLYEPGNVRITLDTHLRASAPWSQIAIPALAPHLVILEVKYDHFLPALVSSLLAESCLAQAAISKYILCRERLHSSFLTV